MTIDENSPAIATALDERKRPKILISEPAAADYLGLPYIVAILKSYWEHNGSDRDAFTWLEPIWLRETAEGNLDDYCAEPVDILGLSCYTWNWELQVKVAKWAKAKNPNCLILAGGPDPDYKDPDFFVKHPYIDVVVVKDGEIPFTQILETYLKGEREFRNIRGLYLPSTTTSLRLLGDPASAHIFTGPAEVPTEFIHSPYVENAAMYERMAASLKGKGWIQATLETTRGCPYTCSYCDWGSSTMSKIRKFDMSRVEAEVDLLGRIGANFIFVADANFGILERDVTIADMIAATKAKYGTPQRIYYSSAKNSPDRTVEIARRTYNAGLSPEHILAVQHTDSEVLAGTARSNISATKYRQVVTKLFELGIPCEVQMILGIPGDTVEKWRDSLAELMAWGVHDNYQISPYALLPNAPAAEPAFLAKWQMKTIERGLVPFGGTRDKKGQSYTKSKIVVGWKGFEDQDWVEVSTYSAFVKALHNRAFTRLPAMYLHYTFGIPYREIYDTVIDGFCRESRLVAPLYAKVRDVFQNLLARADATDAMELEDYPQSPYLGEPCKWLTVKICQHMDEFYSGLEKSLTARFPDAKHLKSVISYQKQLIVTPDYSSEHGKSFPIDRDWPVYFRTARSFTEYQHLDVPPTFLLPRIAAIPAEARKGPEKRFDFGKGSAAERQLRWLVQSVKVTNTSTYSNYPNPVIKSRFPRLYGGETERRHPLRQVAGATTG